MSRIFTPYELNQLRKYDLQINPSLIGDIPVEYLTGFCEFAGDEFSVTTDTLIPRIETEELLPLATPFILSHPHPITITDIGTGSGCIGISLAKILIKHHIDNFFLYLSDISSAALSVTRNNSLRLLPHHQHRIKYIQSDLLTGFPSEIKIDLLTANLPYIPSAVISTLDPSVKDFEPILALDGGPKGTTIINRLLKSLPHYTSSNFLGLLEIDSTQIFSDFRIPSHIDANIRLDSFQKRRFLSLTSK